MKKKLNLFEIFALVSLIGNDIFVAGIDNRITIAEIIPIAEKVCKQLGIEFDKTGLKV